MSFQPKWYRNPQKRWYRLYNNKKKAAHPPINKWKTMGLFFPDGYPELWVDITHMKTPVRARDTEGRIQYQYWPKTREQNRRHHWRRFHEIGSAFWNQLIPLLRQPFPRSNENWSNMDIYRLMLNFSLGCGVRPGYPKYRDQNNSFGVCTLEWKHMQVEPNWDSPQHIEIEFPGKKHVFNTCECDKKSGGWERDFISYLKKRRNWGYLRSSDPIWLDSTNKTIHPNSLLDYLHDYVHPKMTVKDLRTWLIHHNAWDFLQKLGDAHRLTDKERKQGWRSMIKEVAEQTHHTPSVCQSSYLCPSMKNAWMEGSAPFRGRQASEERWFKIWWDRDSRR